MLQGQGPGVVPEGLEVAPEKDPSPEVDPEVAPEKHLLLLEGQDQAQGKVLLPLGKGRGHLLDPDPGRDLPVDLESQGASPGLVPDLAEALDLGLAPEKGLDHPLALEKDPGHALAQGEVPDLGKVLIEIYNFKLLTFCSTSGLLLADVPALAPGKVLVQAQAAVLGQGLVQGQGREVVVPDQEVVAQGQDRGQDPGLEEV